MNILFLNTSFDKGGAAQIANTIYKKVDSKNKYNNYFIHGRGYQAKDNNVQNLTYSHELYLHGGITRLLGIEGFGTFFSTKEIKKFISKSTIDLIHFHNIHGYYLDFSLIKFISTKNIPVVWTLHDTWAFTGSCAYFYDCKKWQNECSNCPYLKTYPKNYYDNSKYMWHKKKELFSNTLNATIVTPSKWLAENAKKSFLKNQEIRVINNGININKFKPYDSKKIKQEYNIPTDKNIVLFVAADLEDERKGAKYFFEALKKIKSDNTLVVTIGKKYKEKFNIDNVNIKQLGYVYDREKLSKVYSMADVYCITSLDDNFPTTVLESLASGTPIVGFDVGGISEQINPGCGFTVKPKDSKALANKIDILIENIELNKEMSKNSRNKAVNKYSIDTMVYNYIELYDEILA